MIAPWRGAGEPVPWMTRRAVVRLLVTTLLVVWPPMRATCPASQEPAKQFIQVMAMKYAFVPGRIEVNQDDLLRITVRSADIAHSFVIDRYRIDRRIEGGATATVEFRADQSGTFPIYCSLRQDAGCRSMRAVLVVHGRPSDTPEGKGAMLSVALQTDVNPSRRRRMVVCRALHSSVTCRDNELPLRLGGNTESR